MLQTALAKIESGLLYLSAGLIFLLMGFIVVVIFGRVVGFSIIGYVDVIEMTLPAIAILGISHLQRTGKHLRMDLIVDRIHSRSIRKGFALLSLGLGLAISLILCSKTYTHFARAYSFGDSTIDAEIPTWPSKGIVSVALAILSIRIALQIVEVLTDKPNGELAIRDSARNSL